MKVKVKDLIYELEQYYPELDVHWGSESPSWFINEEGYMELGDNGLYPYDFPVEVRTIHYWYEDLSLDYLYFGVDTKPIISIYGAGFCKLENASFINRLLYAITGNMEHIGFVNKRKRKNG